LAGSRIDNDVRQEAGRRFFCSLPNLNAAFSFGAAGSKLQTALEPAIESATTGMNCGCEVKDSEPEIG
jgi:hypothetical protein